MHELIHAISTIPTYLMHNCCYTSTSSINELVLRLKTILMAQSLFSIPNGTKMHSIDCAQHRLQNSADVFFVVQIRGAMISISEPPFGDHSTVLTTQSASIRTREFSALSHTWLPLDRLTNFHTETPMQTTLSIAAIKKTRPTRCSSPIRAMTTSLVHTMPQSENRAWLPNLTSASPTASCKASNIWGDGRADLGQARTMSLPESRCGGS